MFNNYVNNKGPRIKESMWFSIKSDFSDGDDE